MKAFNKTKEFIKKNETVLICSLVGGVCSAGGYLFGDKIATWCIARGIEKFADKGVLKFFNPETGVEVNIEEATKLLKNV